MSRMLVLQATIFILMALGFFFQKKEDHQQGGTEKYHGSRDLSDPSL